MGKNAEPSDIANSCSYEPTADEKKFSISKGTYKNQLKMYFFFVKFNF